LEEHTASIFRVEVTRMNERWDTWEMIGRDQTEKKWKIQIVVLRGGGRASSKAVVFNRGYAKTPLGVRTI